MRLLTNEVCTELNTIPSTLAWRLLLMILSPTVSQTRSPTSPQVPEKRAAEALPPPYSTDEDRLAEMGQPAKRVALRLALRSTDAGRSS
jgi:hypothetical protein